MEGSATLPDGNTGRVIKRGDEVYMTDGSSDWYEAGFDVSVPHPCAPIEATTEMTFDFHDRTYLYLGDMEINGQSLRHYTTSNDVPGREPIKEETEVIYTAQDLWINNTALIMQFLQRWRYVDPSGKTLTGEAVFIVSGHGEPNTIGHPDDYPNQDTNVGY